MREIVLCVCGHAHFSGDQCFCGCSIFTADDGKADIGAGFLTNGFHWSPTIAKGRRQL